MILLILSALIFSGCVDISDRGLSDTPSVTETAAPPVSTAGSTPETTQTTTTEDTAPPVSASEDDDAAFSEEYGVYTLTEEDMELLSGCVFVGDSICSGLANYGILPAKQVAAQGNIAARNIFDFSFTENGASLSLLSLLVDSKPKYIVFSMGMNDVNIATKREFTENYRELLKTVEGFLPSAKLIVLSITPVSEDSTFTSNENIDGFNEALREYLEDEPAWTYVDITPEMKNSLNSLKKNYNGGDGVHLSPDAYYALLSQLCDALNPERAERQR